MNTQIYTNPFNESYTITKFRYYISNVNLKGAAGSTAAINSYHLVDEAVPASLSFNFETEENSFGNLEFILGVDNTRNVSGAQTGALDPVE